MPALKPGMAYFYTQSESCRLHESIKKLTREDLATALQAKKLFVKIGRSFGQID